jgi:hypothetical protein
LKEKYRKIKWREDEEEHVSSYRMTFRIKKVLDLGRGSIRSFSVENSLW